MEQKPSLSFLQICNMSVGFFGIQFGWGLQMGNMTSIYEYLNAEESKIALLWLAAPLTGLIVQPIIGHCSDRTWTVLGRRRPYFLGGAILSSIALFLMPQSTTLWMAAVLLWMLDASVNVSMEPFRAFVSDMLPERQRSLGFAMQSAFIGAGAVVANLLPGWLQAAGVASIPSPQSPIPQTIHYAFSIGAIVFLVAIFWTVFSTKEYPPTHDELAKMRAEKNGLSDFFNAVWNIPNRMKALAVVQFFTWIGLFCMWIFFPTAFARDILGATDTNSEIYVTGKNIANECFAVYNFVAFLAAIVFLGIAKWVSAKWLHSASLLLGGLGLLWPALMTIEDPASLMVDRPYSLYVAFAGVGIAWASILSMPYAMLSGCIPSHRTGVYMGIFNFFIVIPQILVAIILSRVFENIESFNRMHAVIVGGVCMLLAAFITTLIRYQPSSDPVISSV